jgi:hypothetical protein
MKLWQMCETNKLLNLQVGHVFGVTEMPTSHHSPGTHLVMACNPYSNL